MAGGRAGGCVCARTCVCGDGDGDCDLLLLPAGGGGKGSAARAAIAGLGAGGAAGFCHRCRVLEGINGDLEAESNAAEGSGGRASEE